MRRTVFAFVLMSIAGTAHAQLVPLPPTVVAVPVIPAYSNSVIDHEGNVLIFDVFYSYAAQSANQALFRIPTLWLPTPFAFSLSTAVHLKRSQKTASSCRSRGAGWKLTAEDLDLIDSRETLVH